LKFDPPPLNGSTHYDGSGRTRHEQKRHKPEEIVSKLRQVEILVDQRMNPIDAIREIGIAGQTL